MFNQAVTPKEWKIGFMLLIFKNDYRQNCVKYRCIVVSSARSEVYGRVIISIHWKKNILVERLKSKAVVKPVNLLHIISARNWSGEKELKEEENYTSCLNTQKRPTIMYL